MPDSLKEKILIGFQCVQTGELQDRYFSELKSQNSQFAPQIEQSYDCYRSSGNPRQCLSQVMQEVVSDLSGDALAFCYDMGSNLDRFNTMGDFLQQAQERLAEAKDLRGGEGEGLNFLISFFSQAVAGSMRESFERRLVSDPEMSLRRVRYQPERFKRLQATTCPQKNEWIFSPFFIPNFPYPVYLYRPAGDDYPLAPIREDLKIGFEVLKAVLTPRDLKTILSPGNGPDLAFYVGTKLTSSERGREKRMNQAEIFKNCGLRTDDRDGEYNSETNRITLLPSPESSYVEDYLVEDDGTLDKPEAIRMGLSANTGSHLILLFFHEIAHAMDHRFLKDKDSPYRENIERLYQWTKQQYEASSENLNLIPNYFFRPSMQSQEKPPYALKNSNEFFAELVMEYLYYRLRWEKPPGPRFQARIQLMEKFFARDGIDPSAFSRSNIEKAYRSAGVDIDWPSQPALNIRVALTRTDGEHVGGLASIGIHSYDWDSFSFGGGVLMGGQGIASTPTSPGLQILLGFEGVLATPRSRLGLELFGRAGMAGGDGTSFFLEPGLRVLLTPSPEGSKGFHLYGGISYFVDTASFDQSVPRGELGVGFNIH